MSAARNPERERRRLIAAAERGRRRRAHQLAQQARTADRLAELDAELKAAEAGLAELDRLDPTETAR